MTDFASSQSDASRAKNPSATPIRSIALRKMLARGYVVAIGVFLILLLARDWPEFVHALTHAAPLMLISAAIFNIAALLVQSTTWIGIQRAAEVSVTASPRFWDAVRLFLVGYLGRYIPGKVGMIVGRVYALERYGYSRGRIIYAAIFENVAFLAGALLVGVGIAVICSEFSPIPGSILDRYAFSSATFAAFVLVCVVLSMTPAAERLVSFSLSVCKPGDRSALSTELNVAMAPLATQPRVIALLLSTISNLFLGISYALVLAGLQDLDLDSVQFLLAIGAFPLAVAAGVLALFAPSGVGVREGALVLFLHDLVPSSTVLLSAIVMRVMMCGVEVSLYGAALFFTRKRT